MGDKCSVGLLSPTSLCHSSPLAPKLVVDHWIYALKRRGERRSKAPRFLVFLRFDKHTTTHHGSMHPWLFVLFIHPYTPAVSYPKLPTPSFRSLLPFLFSKSHREGQSYVPALGVRERCMSCHLYARKAMVCMQRAREQKPKPTTSPEKR